MFSPRYWRTKAQRYTLLGVTCPQCGSKHFPPRERCPDCLRPASETVSVSGPNQSYYFSLMNLAMTGHEAQAPATAEAR
jgi:uncharacterized OB-fold protein